MARQPAAESLTPCFSERILVGVAAAAVGTSTPRHGSRVPRAPPARPRERPTLRTPPNWRHCCAPPRGAGPRRARRRAEHPSRGPQDLPLGPQRPALALVGLCNATRSERPSRNLTLLEAGPCSAAPPLVAGRAARGALCYTAPRAPWRRRPSPRCPRALLPARAAPGDAARARAPHNGHATSQALCRRPRLGPCHRGPGLGRGPARPPCPLPPAPCPLPPSPCPLARSVNPHAAAPPARTKPQSPKPQSPSTAVPGMLLTARSPVVPTGPQAGDGGGH
jgi:hypothetical protein